MTLKISCVLAGIISLACVTTACAGGGAAGSAAAPSNSSFVSTGSGATITGTIATSIAARSLTALGSSTPGTTVTVTGTNVSSPVDSGGRFNLTGVPAGDDDLHISGGGQDAHVRVSAVTEHERINVSLTVSGSTATVEDSDRESDDNEAEVEGIVTAIDLNGRTLTVRDKTISVPKDTPIKHGDVTIDFGQIKVGDRIHVHGTKGTAGIVATKVTVQNAASTSVDRD